MNILPTKIIFICIILTGLLLIPVHAEESGSSAPAESTGSAAAPETGDADFSDIPQAPITPELAMPAAFIPEPEFVFEPVVDGAKVVHDFIIQNQGNAPLVIEDVVTGCACAAADYPPFILPNDEGKVTITIDTTGYGGRDEFSRVIMIPTNEPMNSMLKVMISGPIKDFAHFDPKKVIFLRGKANEKIELSVTITPQENYPFTITSVELDDKLKDLVTISLEKKDNKYIITAENTMKAPGRYMGKVHLDTDSTHKPQISMIIRGIIE